MQSGERSSEISNSTLTSSATKPKSEPKPELPSNWLPFVCTRENLEMVWNKLNQFPILFDDSVRGDFKHFLSEMFDKSSIILLTGDYGIVRVSNIIPSRECDIHLTFWDRRFKGRLEECKQALKWLFNTLNLHRATISVPSMAHSTINFLKALGLVREGVIRDSWSYNGRYLDVWTFGILREEILKEDGNGKQEN